MKLKERNKLRTQEAVEFAGREDFPESLLSPRTEGNTIPLYGVIWLGRNGKPTGNSWTSKTKAESVRDARLADGTFQFTFTTYCAGFA